MFLNLCRLLCLSVGLFDQPSGQGHEGWWYVLEVFMVSFFRVIVMTTRQKRPPLTQRRPIPKEIEQGEMMSDVWVGSDSHEFRVFRFLRNGELS